jgi:opacity protein-like surface antigen
MFMLRGTLMTSVLLAAVAAPAHAQQKYPAPPAATAQAKTQYEVTGFGGMTFGGGVNGDPVVAPAGTFTGIGVKSGPSFGASFAWILDNGGEIGVQWGHQFSKLTANGPAPLDIGNMSIDHYHVYVGYNGLPDAKVRPYVTVGFGATDYGAVNYTTLTQSGQIPGPTRFSFIVGAGVKAWATDQIAIRAGLQWMPTYLSSNGENWSCGSFWGCYSRANATFSNQIELSGGVVFRFGGK